jgi:hypothetical protein
LLKKEKAANNITEEQIETYREAFSMYDRNGDAKITLDEFGDVIKSLGLDPTEEQLATLMQEIDLDGRWFRIARTRLAGAHVAGSVRCRKRHCGVQRVCHLDVDQDVARKGRQEHRPREHVQDIRPERR